MCLVRVSELRLWLRGMNDISPAAILPPSCVHACECSMPPNEMIAALAANEGVSQEKMRCRIFRRGDGVITGEFDVTELLDGARRGNYEGPGARPPPPPAQPLSASCNPTCGLVGMV